MKRNIVLALVFAGAIGMTGCGINANPGSDAINTASNVENSVDEAGNADESVAEVSTAETTEGSTEASDASSSASSEENSADAYQKYIDYISPKKKEDVELDSESEKLYQGFIDGTEKASFDAKGDIGQYLCLSAVLEDGQSYTLDEIKEKLAAEGEYGEGWLYDITSEKYVDLGLDGSHELCLDMGAAEFNLTMVIKNIDGKLKICFAGDSWSRNQVFVKYSGYVESYGSGGATVHGGENGYIDAEGNYHFWYRDLEEGIMPSDDGKLIYNEQLIGENIGMYVETFSFDRDTAGKEYQYVYIVDSEGREHVEVDLSQPGNAYEMAQKAIEESGITYLATDADANALMEEQRKAIGLSDEVYKYGNELRPW